MKHLKWVFSIYTWISLCWDLKLTVELLFLLVCFILQVFLKIEEKDVENALKDRTLMGSILAAGLPS